MSLTLWHFDTLTPLNCLEYWISISYKVLQCIQRAIRPLFWWKNGRVDGRKNPLFGAFRIVFGLHLSIFGVSDLPILGSNLVKTGVQGVIFDKFWWSLVFCASLADSCTSPPRYVFSGVTLSAACHIAKIMNFLLFCKKIPYYMGLEGIKNKKFRYESTLISGHFWVIHCSWTTSVAVRAKLQYLLLVGSKTSRSLIWAIIGGLIDHLESLPL